MGVQSYTLNELIQFLSNGKFDHFRYTDYYAVTHLNDGVEVLFELNDGKISDELVDFSVMVLKNFDKCIKDAQLWLKDIKRADQMYSDAFDLGFELYGITFGKFEYGHRSKPATDGFTISFSTVNYYPCAFTVKYHKNMHPFAIEEWVE